MEKIAQTCPDLSNKVVNLNVADSTRPPSRVSNLSLANKLNKSFGKVVHPYHQHLVGRAFTALESVNFADRLAGGSILALLGDPRIRPGKMPQMAYVSGGHTQLGLPYEDVEEVVARFADVGVIREWIEKECPRHTVELAPYQIGIYPVTNIEYLAFLKDNLDAEIPTSWSYGRYPFEEANHPVFTVKEETADLYCDWLSEKTGMPFRLPTEAEWEHAAGNSVYPWGKEFSTHKANTAESELNGTTPVGIYPGGRSWSGCYDMAGNVEEYTSSFYKPYPGGARVVDDLNRDNRVYRIARGGSFARYADLCRVTRRHGRYNSNLYAMGFRVAMDVS